MNVSLTLSYRSDSLVTAMYRSVFNYFNVTSTIIFSREESLCPLLLKVLTFPHPSTHESRFSSVLSITCLAQFTNHSLPKVTAIFHERSKNLFHRIQNQILCKHTYLFSDLKTIRVFAFIQCAVPFRDVTSKKHSSQ